MYNTVFITFILALQALRTWFQAYKEISHPDVYDSTAGNPFVPIVY